MGKKLEGLVSAVLSFEAEDLPNYYMVAVVPDSELDAYLSGVGVKPNYDDLLTYRFPCGCVYAMKETRFTDMCSGHNLQLNELNR